MLEARAAARLQHPNVLTVYRVGELDGRPYLITEFIHGKTLDEVAMPMPWRRALELGVGPRARARGGAPARRAPPRHQARATRSSPTTARSSCSTSASRSCSTAALPPSTWRSPTGAAAAPGASARRRERCRAGRDARLDPRRRGRRDDADLRRPAVRSPKPGRSWARPTTWRPSSGAESRPRVAPTSTRSAPCSSSSARASRRTGICPRARLSAARAEARRAPPHDVVPAGEPQARRRGRALPAPRPRRALRLRRRAARGARAARADLARRGTSRRATPTAGCTPSRPSTAALFFGRRAEVGTLLERLRVEPLVVVAGDSRRGQVLALPRRRAARGARRRARRRARLVRRALRPRAARPLLALGAALAPLLGLDDGAVVRRLRAHPGAVARAIRKRLGDGAGPGALRRPARGARHDGATRPARASSARRSATSRMGLPGVRLLMTVRSDFLAPVAALPGLGDEIARALYFLKPLSREGIREAITGPARATGVAFESEALVDTLVDVDLDGRGRAAAAPVRARRAVGGARPGRRAPSPRAALEKIGGVTRRAGAPRGRGDPGHDRGAALGGAARCCSRW